MLLVNQVLVRVFRNNLLPLHKTFILMKQIPSQLIKDYCIVGLSYIAILLFLRPAFFGEYKITESLMLVAVVHSFVLLLVYAIAEGVTTFLFRCPFSYSYSLEERFQHFVLCAGICIPVMMVLLTLANVIMMHGIEHIDYAWLDSNGNFTFGWMLMSRSSCVVASVIMAIAMIVISEVRQMRYVLQELLQINHMLEENQEKTKSIPTEKELVEDIVLHGDTRDTLTLNPHDILYIESMANYLNIVYFNDSELCHKRLRSSLKETETTLEEYTFIVHIHRAFLVNINFITQVTGNSAGYKVELFGCDKILPVSKSNVPLFKERLKET